MTLLEDIALRRQMAEQNLLETREHFNTEMKGEGKNSKLQLYSFRYSPHSGAAEERNVSRRDIFQGIRCIQISNIVSGNTTRQRGKTKELVSWKKMYANTGKWEHIWKEKKGNLRPC